MLKVPLKWKEKNQKLIDGRNYTELVVSKNPTMNFMRPALRFKASVKFLAGTERATVHAKEKCHFSMSGRFCAELPGEPLCFRDHEVPSHFSPSCGTYEA
jgi:hypothetical protein